MINLNSATASNFYVAVLAKGGRDSVVREIIQPLYVELHK